MAIRVHGKSILT